MKSKFQSLIDELGFTIGSLKLLLEKFKDRLKGYEHIEFSDILNELDWTHTRLLQIYNELKGVKEQNRVYLTVFECKDSDLIRRIVDEIKGEYNVMTYNLNEADAILVLSILNELVRR